MVKARVKEIITFFYNPIYFQFRPTLLKSERDVGGRDSRSYSKSFYMQRRFLNDSSQSLSTEIFKPKTNGIKVHIKQMCGIRR